MLSLIAAAALLGGLSTPAAAEEPYLEFIRGLRARRYYDTALEYIDAVKGRRDLPDEVKLLLPYEEGVTLTDGAMLLKNPEKQKEQLDEAAARFEDFVKAAPPDHPLQGEANMQRARIAQNKARVEISQALMPANEGNAEAFRRRARDYITQARDIFQQAHDQYRTRFKAFPTFIPEEEKARRAERKQVEAQFMQSQFDLARTTYDEAQTYPEDSEKRSQLLNQAAAEFEEMHQKYRSQVAGLFARLWQGKSFEEQDEIRKALGIYNEILDHPGSTGSMQRLQDTARRFRLICLNHPDRRDHQLAIDEASQWRRDARNRVRTEIGLGITYELARAYESIAEDRTTPPAEKTEAYKQAKAFATQVSLVPGELRGPAMSMLQRVSAKLGQEEGDPTTFDGAFGAANLLKDDYDRYRAEADAAAAKGDAAGEAAAREKMQAASAEMARMYRLGIQLARSSTDSEQLATAYYRLVYAHYIAGEYLQAAVLGQYVAQRYRTTNSLVASEAAYIAIAAFTQEFNEAQPGDREFELDQVVGQATQIIEDFPESDRANDGKMSVAQLYEADGQPGKAADWYDRVAETSDSYANAQLRAGLAYYNAFVLASNLPDGERPSVDDLAAMREQGVGKLQQGIDLTEQKLASDSATPDLLVIGKRVLAQLRNADGLYRTQGDRTGAIELLTEGPHSVVAAMAVPEGQERPTDPRKINNRKNASATYQTLLRAQIGVRDLEAARQAREKLEAVAGQEDAAELTRIYEAFGRELQTELKQLRQAGQNDRVADVQAAFKEFLDQLAGRQDGQTYNSLLWIAETYGGLGEGAKNAGASAEAATFFDRSAEAYGRILEKAAADPQFVSDPAYLTGVKVRLANSQRLKGDFEAAEKTILGVLAENPKALDAQRDAAKLYDEWASQTGDPAHYKTALAGDKQTGVWGWALTAAKLQRTVDQDPSNEQYVGDLFDARYRQAETSLNYGRQLTDGDEAAQTWARAKQDINRFAALQGEFPAEQYRRFNELFGELQTQLGEPVTGLDLGDTALVSTEADEDAGEAPAVAITTAPPSQSEAAPVGGSEIQWGPILGVVVFLLAGIGGFVAMNKAADKKRRAKLAQLTGGGSEGEAVAASSARGSSRSSGRRRPGRRR